MKRCPKCGLSKEVSLFYKSKRAKDGLYHWCKKCINEYNKKYKNAPSYREYMQGYKKKYDKKYRVKNREKMREYNNEYYKVYKTDEVVKKKMGCRQKTREYIKSGKIIKGICAECGNKKVEAHHPDYTKPLKVIWLCKKHHHKLHNEKRSI